MSDRFHILKMENRLLAWARRLRRHVSEWRAVLDEEEVDVTSGTWIRMARALLTGGVNRRTWNARMRVCLRCPIFDRELRRCRAPAIGGGVPHGCGCYVVFLASTRRPYDKGCWGRTYLGSDVGWGIDSPEPTSKPTA